MENILSETPAVQGVTLADLPAIGTQWQGGIYAGKSIHNDVAVALILLPHELTAANWDDACKWAAEQGGELPSRFDQLALFTNLKSEFQPEWYWSGAPYGADYAWSQGFYGGAQVYWARYDELRGRAVRRLVIR